MSTINFHFKNTKPMSLNNIYATSKNGRRFKTSKAVELEKHMTCELFTKKPEIFTFENSVSIYEHYLECRIIYFMPETKLFIKKGSINKKSGDVDNLAKPIVDNCFKFFDKLDDSIVCHIDALKCVSPDSNYSISISFERKEKSDLYKLKNGFINP